MSAVDKFMFSQWILARLQMPILVLNGMSPMSLSVTPCGHSLGTTTAALMVTASLAATIQVLISVVPQGTLHHQYHAIMLGWLKVPYMGLQNVQLCVTRHLEALHGVNVS